VYGPWTGWQTDWLTGTTFDPNGQYTNAQPVDENTPPAIINLTGKYLVRVNNAGVIATWSNSVRIGPDQAAQPLKIQKRFYFDAGASTLSNAQLTILKTWIKQSKSTIGAATVTATIKSFSQGNQKSTANRVLGLGRSKSIKNALGALKFKAKVSDSYAGPSGVLGANGRYAIVTLTWMPAAG